MMFAAEKSHNRVSPKAGWVDAKQLPRGPNGRALCRRCGTEVPKGSRTFCSDDCVHEWRLRSDPGYLRLQVFARDKGVCAECGIDAAELGKRLMAEWQGVKRGYGVEQADARTAFLRRYPWFLGRTTYWDADHIVPVVEGGGETGLDNLRTLCIPCHQSATADLAKRRATERRRERDQRAGRARLLG